MTFTGDDPLVLFEEAFGYSVCSEGYYSGALPLDENETSAALLALDYAKQHGFDKRALRAFIARANRARKLNLSDDSLDKACRLVELEAKGFSFLDSLLRDDNIEDISACENGIVRAYLRRRGWVDCNVRVVSGQKLVDLVNRISRPMGRRLSLRQPVLSATIGYGRLHAVIPPVSSRVELSIRRFNLFPLSPREIIDLGSTSSEAMGFLWLCVQCGSNIVICGNTGSGKTSLLNALLSFVPLDERMVCIEETPEVVAPHHSQLVRLVAQQRAGCRTEDLVTGSLRMRPDRLVLGEVRSREEATALMNSLLAGQGNGSFATFHAGSANECLSRLSSLSQNAPGLGAIDIIVTQKRWHSLDEQRDVRKVTEICALTKDYDGERVPSLLPVFSIDPKGSLRLDDLGSPAFEKIKVSLGNHSPEAELSRRKHFLEQAPSDFAEFSSAANDFMGAGLD
ncbi:CpaF family protein [Candidatus Micrarchaeota archaeon]|nr:CpaF family protein [Candidatus Micrarchaeota archaeon]